MFLALFLMVYIFLSLFVLLECVLQLKTSTIETFSYLLSYKNKAIDIKKIEKYFLNSTTDTQS